MSCCLVLLSSDTLDMLSWTSTFRICHSSKRKRDKWLLQYVPVCIWTRRIHSHINTESTVQRWFCTKLQRPLQNLLPQLKHPQWQREKPQVTTNTPPSVPSRTTFLQRTFLPISDFSLVSTQFFQRMQSPITVTTPSYKPSFSGITAKLSWSSTLSPFKSFTLLLFARWNRNKLKILLCLLIKPKLMRATMKSSSRASPHPPSTKVKLEANTTALLISTSQPGWKPWTLYQ